MLSLPAYNQIRILHDQKYPKREPQKFRTPYYQPALAAIREYYSKGNDATVLAKARSDAQSIRVESRRLNVVRVIDTFASSSQARRQMTPQSNRRRVATLGNVEIRLSSDMRAVEINDARVIYYNCRQVAVASNVALLATEIAHWVLEQNGERLGISDVEFVDLASARVHRARKARPTTLKLLRSNAKIIETLWPTI